MGRPRKKKVEEKPKRDTTNVGRPKKDSTLGILALIRSHSSDDINVDFVKKELIDIFSKLHDDKSIIFLEQILEGKFYCQDDVLSWINNFSKDDDEIRILGKKIEEMIQGRIKHLVATNNGAQSFMKYIMEAEFSYSKKGKSVNKNTAVGKVKNKSLDMLLGKLTELEDNEDEVEEDNG